MRVRDVMSRPPVTVRADTPVADVARTMLTERIGCVLVVDDNGDLLGIITESDFTGEEVGIAFSDFRDVQVLNEWLTTGSLAEIFRAAAGTMARAIMSERPVTVGPDTPIEEAIRLMVRTRHARLPVVEGNRPVGVLARHDLLKAALAGVPVAP